MRTLSQMFDSLPTRANLGAAFDSTEAAARLEAIPADEYEARAVDGKLDESRKGTPFYGIRLEIASGEHAGRHLLAKWFLSPAALAYSKRDLAALGLSGFGQLERGEVPGGLLRLRVVLRRDDSGGAFNEVRAVLPLHNEAKAVLLAPAAPSAPVQAAPNPEPISAPVAASVTAAPVQVNELPAALLDAGLL